MSRAILAVWCVLGSALAVAAPAVAAAPAERADVAATRVSYVAGGSVYLEAGRLEGMREGDTLQVVAAGRSGRLVVRYLSSHRAVCDTLGLEVMPAVGDPVRYVVRPAAEPGADAAGMPSVPAESTAVESSTTMASASRPARPKGARLRGRIGGRYLVVAPSGSGGFSQPALDLRLDATRLAGGLLDLAVDLRSHRTVHAAGLGDDGEARVYRLAASVHDATGRRRVTIGRQLASAVGPVSLFDGALAELTGTRWNFGLFSGAQPDPLRWRVSTDVLQHGGYVSLHGGEAARRWSMTGGGVASFEHGQVDRQFGFVQGSLFDPRGTLTWIQEVDLNTGWKRTPGVSVVSWTSTFVSARAQATPWLALDGGYDGRRDVRLYRDRETPETEFDDRYRQGEWVGVSVQPARHLRVATDGRWSSGGAGGAFNAWSASVEGYRLPVLETDLRWRSTRYEGALARGWLHAAGVAVRPAGLVRLDVSGGWRRSEEGAERITTTLAWESVDLDLGFARRWYLLLSGERDHGDGTDDRQAYVSLSWTF